LWGHMPKFYDPITERWFNMPTKKEPEKVIEAEEDIYQRAYRLNRINNIWEAVTSSATATQITE